MALDDATLKRLLVLAQEKQALLEARKLGASKRANPVHIPYMDRRRRAKKNKARYLSHQAVKKGIIIKRLECEVCKSANDLQMHHEDYDKPLEVMWLCRNCHQKREATQHDKQADQGSYRQSQAEELG